MVTECGIVMIVEDNQAIVDSVRNALEINVGCIVVAAGTAVKAMEALKAMTPDVVVLDVMLPDGDGVKLAPEIKARTGAAILFLSAKTDIKDILKGLEAGDDYMTKPHDNKVLSVKVSKLLDLMRQKKAPSRETLLNETELSVARMAAQGHANKEIADALYISERSVKNCLTNIYRKFGIADDPDKRRMMARMLA